MDIKKDGDASQAKLAYDIFHSQRHQITYQLEQHIQTDTLTPFARSFTRLFEDDKEWSKIFDFSS